MTAPLGRDEIFRDSYSGYNSGIAFFGVAHLLAVDAPAVLDVGCGRGGQVDAGGARPWKDLRGPGRHVIGIDVDEAGAQNTMIDEFRRIEGERWPLDDGSVDLVFSDFTLEHVVDPESFVREMHRVLRTGGAVVARSISRWSPLAIAARLVPNRRHARVLRVLQPGRHERDVFPTEYRMNSERDLRRLLDDRFEWAVTHRGGLEAYFFPWPRLARVVRAVEQRLPKAMGTTIVLYARKR